MLDFKNPRVVHSDRYQTDIECWRDSSDPLPPEGNPDRWWGCGEDADYFVFFVDGIFTDTMTDQC